MSWNTKFLGRKFSLVKTETLHVDDFDPAWVLWFGCTDKSPLASAQHPTGASSPSPPWALPSRPQGSASTSLHHTALPLSPTLLLSLDYKPTPEKYKMQKASGKGCMPSWKGTSCLGVIPSYGEGIAAPRATGRLRRREKFNLNL